MGTIGSPESGVTGSATITTETQLLNDALSQIGATRISNIDDESVNANHCLAFYGPLRDAYLRRHHWNFAYKRAQLAQNLTAPVSGYAYSYRLPPDSLKVTEYGGANPVSPSVILTQWSLYGRPGLCPFKIESGNLVSNDGVAYIAYIWRNTNPATWDPLFYQAVATGLASKLAGAIPKDIKTASFKMEEAEAILATAMSIDGQEGSVAPFVVNDLIWGR